MRFVVAAFTENLVQKSTSLYHIYSSENSKPRTVSSHFS